MRDRLAALQSAQSNDDEEGELEDSGVVINFGDDSSANFMQEFFQEVEETRGSIDSIRECLDKLKKTYSALLAAPQPKKEDKAEVDRLVKEVKKHASKVRSKLKDIQKSIEEDKMQQNLKSPADFRIRKNQYGSLHHDFLQAMTEYSNAQLEYREKCKDRIQRQLQITGQSTTEEEIENMLESGSSAVFTSSIITETQQAKQALGDIEARYDELIKLEQSIKELHDMFVDLATLVEEQGEMVNNVERNVSEAADYVAQAQESTKKAVAYQSKARRKKIIIIIIITVAIAVLVTLLVILLT
ncbi:syntaxin-1A-like isoform X1 [Ptychodera flava]|uniref:syntaxin-1A-like isoform X1 n=1 Tax=Ptychodera flava TaxID=63121 RepID=UPI00396A1DCF